ncbi:Holliday junction branch migration protein RuvA [Phaeovibrio sulfidiphilus]|uniref:Holliday junction branch migration complex subunit RuvA n=1 Tax=Phaeovibrio sulfidiphilus TaxID=1220600 RepID=A0A8J6YN27_9PROT|nr:Holliday junction branch migration protein RuvA [Phaeovibrio sulfidiphilus]MBE1237798.1 Holliday junction branch migration protein RuvA [Phaeovibrio sulfidiphilus]
MIALLRGRIHALGEDWVVIDTGGSSGGVGYLVHCSGRTLQALGRAGDEARLLVETHVREDAINLFGFSTETERDWFRLLFTVQGIGAKVALSLLSVLTPDALGRSIASGDRASLSRAPGVGPKLAARLCTELKEKAAALVLAVPVSAPSGDDVAPRPQTDDAPGAAARSDAVSALVNLGYPRMDAFDAVTRIAAALEDADGDGEITANSLIQQALRELGKGLL